jgi:hypothetical protein
MHAAERHCPKRGTEKISMPPIHAPASLPAAPPTQGDLFKKLIRSGGVLEEAYVAAEVILPLLLTLQHLHSARIFHRDIKSVMLWGVSHACAPCALQPGGGSGGGGAEEGRTRGSKGVRC